jgi:hypothetical protein
VAIIDLDPQGTAASWAIEDGRCQRAGYTNIDVAGFPTTWGAPAFAGAIPPR